MDISKKVKLGICVLIPIIVWFISPPEGLNPTAWKLFGFYLAAILGLMLKPMPEPLVLLTTIAGASIFLNQTKQVLSGYQSTTTWLVFCAFALSIAFVKTGLGNRFAYTMVRKFGNTTLRLGYITAALDFVLSPVTPSNTARSGGIVFPIVNSVAKSLGSEPGPTANKAGSYLLSNVYFVTKVTSFIFLTAMAPNLLAYDYMNKILGVELTWGSWAYAMIIPGILCLAVVPSIGYLIHRPTIKKIDGEAVSKEGLEQLGPMKASEKRLIVIFILALIGWALPSIFTFLGLQLDINATAVALVAMVACFLFGVMDWKDMLANKGVWNTFLWFGGIVGMSSALKNLHFFDWLAKVMNANIHFEGNVTLALLGIGILSILVRYLFASGTAYIVAMLPVFLTVGHAAGINPMVLALVLASTDAYGGALTHYGGGPGPIVFGAGYNGVKQWWINGAINAFVCFAITMTIGIAWWQITGFIH